jgi:hypothetical protein
MMTKDLLAKCERESRHIYYRAVTQAQIANSTDLENLRAVEDVLMCGYPNGLWDDKNSLPLIRRGITATHPAVDYCGRPEAVVDIACFPGSSGSPIAIVNEGFGATKDDTSSLGNRFMVLGVLYAGPVMTATGEIVRREIPTGKVRVVETPSMLHLGYYIKAREIATLCEVIVKRIHDAESVRAVISQKQKR